MILRRGKVKGTLVTDYPVGEERQYMIDLYGGRLVAEGMSEIDIFKIICMQVVLEDLLSGEDAMLREQANRHNQEVAYLKQHVEFLVNRLAEIEAIKRPAPIIMQLDHIG